MTRLILTEQSGASLAFSDRGDVVVPLSCRFVWGPLPSPQQLAGFLAARSDQHGPGQHWLDYGLKWRGDTRALRDLGLVEFCRHCETVELWFDPSPNHQLQLAWLLDYFGSHPDIVARLRVRIVGFDLVTASGEELDRWKVEVTDVTTDELETASLTWQAYRAATPKACFDLLGRDLSALPLLKPALYDLLEELPGTTGLGATEMRLLELIATGYQRTHALFYLRGLRGRHVFDESELGFLLDGLAHGARPAIDGLDAALRTLAPDNGRSRLEAYRRSRLSLTEFGRAIVAHQADFSRHNPIDRWWGGTRLTNDGLWRWNPALLEP